MDITDATSPLADGCAAFAASLNFDTDPVKILSTLLSNLAKEDTAKFRRINLQNAKIKAALVDKGGSGVAVLKAAGFEEVEGGAALEHKADDAPAKCTMALKALDEACSSSDGAPFALRLALPHGGAGVRCCAGGFEGQTLLTGAMDNSTRPCVKPPRASRRRG